MKKNTKRMAKLFTRIIRRSNEDNCCLGDDIAEISFGKYNVASVRTPSRCLPSSAHVPVIVQFS